MKTLEIRIGPDGETSIDVSGFTSADCVSATKPIEDELGTVTKRDKKGEYFRPLVSGTNKLRGG
ncbi:MAG TPA: DUF2997 domain-containing protein [Gemmatimonadaceae bacterium]